MIKIIEQVHKALARFWNEAFSIDHCAKAGSALKKNLAIGLALAVEISDTQVNNL